MTEEADHSTAIIALKSTFLCMCIIVAFIGNVSVLYAIKTFSKLKTMPNYFVFNLAIADLLFCITGMPMILVTTLAEGWILGDFLCNASGFLNSLLCTVSIWTLAMISVNRYFAVAKARDIKKLYTKKRIFYIIGCVWLFSIVVSAPPLLGWSEFMSGSNFCTVNGKKHLSYAVILLSLDYILPLIVLSGLYMRIFFLLQKHERLMNQSQSNVAAGGSKDYNESSFTSDADSIASTQEYSVKKDFSHKEKKILAEFTQKNNNEKPEDKATIINSKVESLQIKPVQEEVNNKNSGSRKYKSVSIKDNHNVVSTSPVMRRKKKGTVIRRFFKEARVTKMLLIVVMAFFLCWTPFIIASAMYGLGVAPTSFQFLTLGIMLACLNSVINPIIYAVMNRNFRYAFQTMWRNFRSLIIAR